MHRIRQPCPSLKNLVFRRYISSSSSSSRGYNLSNRYSTLESTLRDASKAAHIDLNPINTQSFPQEHEKVQASLSGLSKEGLANPKSVQAAARLTRNGESFLDSGDKISSLGVKIPKKPVPPGPEECCMSGCAVCVHDLYLESLNDYKMSLRSAYDNLISRPHPPPVSLWPVELQKMDERRAHQDTDVDDEIDESVDPVTRAFMMLEKQLKKKPS